MLLLLAGLVVGGPARADMTQKDFRQFAVDPSQAKQLEIYLAGLIEGVFWSSAYSRVTKREPIFCLPGNLPLTADTAKFLILNSTWGNRDGDYVASALRHADKKSVGYPFNRSRHVSTADFAGGDRDWADVRVSEVVSDARPWDSSCASGLGSARGHERQRV
ncbi:hypothetical protein, partial [Cupriavidus sp. CuC1]|uniref:hypothetical protein n=1 Tax=Cupriavidus sp. CuC1 TaxID=3373131 RepID=UPI0037D25031